MNLDERWHALLWNHLDVAVGKAEDGIDNLQRLSKFVGKRVAAEKEAASSLLDMCQASKWGLKRDELSEVLRETGRMNEAWAMLLEKTKETCNAHMEVVERLTEEALVPIDAFLRDNTPRCADLASSGKVKQKELADVQATLTKAQLAYYRACTELDHADWLLHAKGKNNQAAVKKRDEARTKKNTCRGAYGESIKALNLTEFMLRDSIGGMLSELRELELARLALTQQAMLAYVGVTAIQLPTMLGNVTDELVPILQAVDPAQNIADELAKQARRAPQLAPGGNVVAEYDQLADCADEHRSIDQLRELAGGPLMEGKLEREAGLRKRFEPRIGLIWPKAWKEHNMEGPKLFLYEGGNAKPDRVVPLHAAACTDLQNPRKERPDAFRVSSGGKEVVLSGMKGAEFTTAEWRALLAALAKGEPVRLTKLFGTSLGEILAHQQEEGGGRVPAVLLCCLDRLQGLDYDKTEGIFRIPGDSVEVSTMKSLFERGLLELKAAEHGDVDLASPANWSSLVKAWLRDLAEPLWPQGAPYEEAMAIAAEFAGANRHAAEGCADTGGDWQVEACDRLATVVQELPEPNRAVLQHVCACLRRIDPVTTKMTIDNLAICWSPCLFRCADISIALANAKKEIFVTGLLITKLHLAEEVLEQDWSDFRAMLEQRRAVENAE
jgi:hypothetical protein